MNQGPVCISEYWGLHLCVDLIFYLSRNQIELVPFESTESILYISALFF